MADARIDGLTAYAHVADVGRSVEFYRHLGLEVASTHEADGKLVWALVTNASDDPHTAGARLMLDTHGDALHQALGPKLFMIKPNWREFDALVAAGRIARYQITPQRAIVYLRSLPPGEGLELRYRLRATMPVKTTSQPARAYEYYNPDRRGESAAIVLTVQRG